MSVSTSVRWAGVAAAAFVVPVLVAGCSSEQAAAPAAQANSVVVTEQWIKAADQGMSAAFGELTNSSDAEAQIVDATSPASARMEIHETVAAEGGKVMRPKAGGLVVPAHGSVSLAPGADHLMFMDLTGPLRTGAEVPVTVKFADGSSATFTAQVRDFPGNKENYAPAGEASSAAHGG
ncbi:copper chaperone PCu(A)C [Nocardia blacklockiae]|uniref:copper chaperone PCu(A)C n=1 Tax=Nocardia blacklockiae TaxID=480036 RepID=UPI0018930AED|nr:copper chaperone PCu(A)C [Nocardia blacklockiae]MBF6170600.1 copper chaperone PCu(A)C [Nocardia blacklockiae]